MTRPIALSAPWIDGREEELVVETLRSGQLSLGPMIDRFEEALAARAGAPAHFSTRVAVAWPISQSRPV